ncbi:hypothetical protein BH10ACI3_BH10ACI3_15490 [soil metagenome]
MNVFEDLVVELQEENLLEKPNFAPGQSISADKDESYLEEMPSRAFMPAGSSHDIHDTLDPIEASPKESEAVDGGSLADPEPAPERDVKGEKSGPVHDEQRSPERAPIPKKPSNGKEFYRKRAVSEVSNLQMVEHVLTGVEREYLKVVPNVFDDFKVKKSLHAFLHVTDNENAPQHQEFEFTLMQETEAWCTALADRDKEIPVSNLRQYCENSRPALSSQAMLALARFYRNLPYSEPVRSKFDFIITRLFSRPLDQDKRVCLFTKDETLHHINTLYRDWSSISLYAADDDESKVLLTALSFEDLAVEAEQASTFDQLIACDFFGRLRMFKESISELFYAPNVTAAAIECNIRIGNAYVDLIDREHQKMDAESIQTKYGDLYDQTISEAAGRTLDLVELLKDRPIVPRAQEEVVNENFVGEDHEPIQREAPVTKPAKVKKGTPFISGLLENAFQINRWLVVSAAILIAASIGIYLWGNFVVRDDATSAGVRAVNLESSSLNEYVKTARVSGENYYVQLKETWDLLPKEKRQEQLQKMLQSAQENGCVQVTLISKDGKPAGYASATKLDVVMP